MAKETNFLKFKRKCLSLCSSLFLTPFKGNLGESFLHGLGNHYWVNLLVQWNQERHFLFGPVNIIFSPHFWTREWLLISTLEKHLNRNLSYSLNHSLTVNLLYYIDFHCWSISRKIKIYSLVNISSHRPFTTC